MINYPISFHATAESKSGINSLWTIASQDISNRCAIPPEFEGPGGALSPEDLFAQALTNCFVATFKVYAEKSKMNFDKVSVQTELVADFSEDKKPVMKNASFTPLFLEAIIISALRCWRRKHSDRASLLIR